MAVEFELVPQGPFSLEASRRFLEGFAPATHAASAPGHFHLAFPVDASDESAGVCVRQAPDPNGPVTVDVVTGTDSSALRAQVARILSLDLDGSGFPEVGARDAVVAGLQRRYPGLRPVAFHSPYEAAAWALISARVSIRQAARTKAAMAEALGTAVEVHGEPLHAFPAPKRLRGLESFPGLFGRKVEWLRGLAEATLDGRLDANRLRSLPTDDALGVDEPPRDRAVLRRADPPPWRQRVGRRPHRRTAAPSGGPARVRTRR